MVVDSAGRPLAKASLVIRESARARDTTTTRTTAESDSVGRFRIVGIAPGEYVLEVRRDDYEPAGFQFNIQNGVTARLTITLVQDVVSAEIRRAADSLAALERDLASAPAAASAAGGESATGSLSGRVMTARNDPVQGADVHGMGTVYETRTDSVGRFRFPALPIGPVFLRIRKLGYEPVVFGATVVPGDSLLAEVTLTPFYTASGQLDTVRVRADGPRGRRLQEFERRRRTASGFFLDRNEIVARQASYLSDLLRGRGNVTVSYDYATGETAIFGRSLSILTGYCPLALIVDGTLMRNMPVDAMILPSEIAAIEVYNSGSRVPFEFVRPGTDCGAVVVWSR